jgi:hypothetical protein
LARPRKGGFCREEEAICSGADGGDFEAGRTGYTHGGAGPVGGISEQTFYRWKKEYTGLEVDQVWQLKQMGEENVPLKRVVADLILDKAMLQDVLRKTI